MCAAPIQTVINNIIYSTKTNSLLFGSEIDGRSTCEFTVQAVTGLLDVDDEVLLDADNEVLLDSTRPGGVDTFIKKGNFVTIQGPDVNLLDVNDEVLLDDDDEELIFSTNIFSGFVDIARKIPISRAEGDEFEYNFDIVCSDMQYLSDKRVVAFSKINTLAGDMAKYIVDNWLYEEGVTYTEDSIEDGNLVLEAVYNYVSASEALDAIAESSGFWWHIDFDKVLHMKSRTSDVAPVILTEEMCLGKPIVKSGNPLYRNIQYISGAQDITSEQIEIQFGDGDKRSFVTGYGIVSEPTIEIDTVSGFVAQTVGRKGVELAQWYWEKNSNLITQEAGEVVLELTDQVKISYIGGFDIMGISSDEGAILEQQALEGGGTSGKVESRSDEAALSGYEAVLELAGYRISKYSPPSNTLEFVTQQIGFAGGQLLTVADTAGFASLGVNGQDLLITKVETFDKDAVIFYKVEAVAGPAHQTWANFFKRLQRQTKSKIRVGIADSRSLLLPNTFTRTWSEFERPNIFAFDFPDDLRFPASDYWPGFEPGNQIKQAVVFDTVEISRKAPTLIENMTPESEEITTTTYYGPTDIIGAITHFGWAGGAQATNVLNTDTVYDKQADARIKTTLESLQIRHIDEKGW